MGYTLLVVGSTSLFCGVPFGSSRAVETSRPVVVSVPTIPAPPQPAFPTAQRTVSESTVRKIQRQRQHRVAGMRLDRTTITGFSPALMSMKARAELETTDTEPRYLKIFLLATPDNHRSPPIA